MKQNKKKKRSENIDLRRKTWKFRTFGEYGSRNSKMRETRARAIRRSLDTVFSGFVAKVKGKRSGTHFLLLRRYNRRPPLPPPRLQNKVVESCGLNQIHIIFPPSFLFLIIFSWKKWSMICGMKSSAGICTVHTLLPSYTWPSFWSASSHRIILGPISF